MNQGDFLICVAAGFFCAGYTCHCDGGSKREERMDGRMEGWIIRCSSFGRKIFVLRSGRERWEGVKERGGRRVPVVGCVLEREAWNV